MFPILKAFIVTTEEEETALVDEIDDDPELAEREIAVYQAIDPDPLYNDAPDNNWKQLGIIAGSVLLLAGALFFLRKKISNGAKLPVQVQEVSLTVPSTDQHCDKVPLLSTESFSALVD